MNPLTNVKNITKLNQIELEKGTIDKKSWHDIYKESAWIFVGGLAYGLTEGDILSVFSQYGEIVNINLVRDKKTGKIKGFCFLCYANQKSTVLAVDNFNGIKLCGRTIRVDHVANYKPPKENEDEDDITKQLKAEGCAPKPLRSESTSKEVPKMKKVKKVKKEKKKHKKHKKRSIKQEDSAQTVKVKDEKYDPGYAKYELSGKGGTSSRDVQKSESEDSESSSDDSSGSDSNHHRKRERAGSKTIRKHSRTELSSGRKIDVHDRSRVNTDDDKGTRETNNFKRRRNDSSSDGSVKRKKSHKADSSSKREKRESSARKHVFSAEKSSDSSPDESSKRYSSSNKRKSPSRKHLNVSDVSPVKDKSSGIQQNHKRSRHSSSSSETDSSRKQNSNAKDKSKRDLNIGNSSHPNSRGRKDSSPKSHKNNYSSSGNVYSKSHTKYKQFEQSYKSGSDSTDSRKHSKDKSLRQESRSSKNDRNKD